MMSEILRRSLRWAVLISLVTACLSMGLTIVSGSFLRGLPWGGGLLIVILIVITGVIFDMLGIAATAAQEKPFHSMASRKVVGARHAIAIIRKADQFSNFCNDVVGDISGIVSGAGGFAVAASLYYSLDLSGSSWWLETIVIGCISAVTVGGKALGKAISIRYSNKIIFRLGKFFYLLEKRFHIHLFDVKNKKKRKRKRGVLRAPRTDKLA
ncbi:hypothetical protein SAMN05444487_10469 [Marininema mesophilum]|uniref:CNNM transmembrane domain-containing protein n=1 Tax=Marininema mesophilum TaxID=1048340 RepID=A0A1H2UCZ7_9BACL|nr:hypothetical protein [Marininema mesophilum]SDW53985.1 hypothetical protein SAMN05444487_10469 [Marininema mesophilum]